MSYRYILILRLRFGKMLCICLHRALVVSVIPVVGRRLRPADGSPRPISVCVHGLFLTMSVV